MNRRFRHSQPAGAIQRSVKHAGQTYEVLDRLSVRRKTYWLIERLSTSRRERYLAVDPSGGPGGRLVTLAILPRGTAARQHLTALARQSRRFTALPRILDLDVQSGRTIVVLTWVAGPSLAAYLSERTDPRRRIIGPTVALHRLRILAHELSSLHLRQRLVHGDIKPENLIVCRDPGRFVLIDYGSAWTAERTVSREEGDGVSPGYAAPECSSHQRHADFRSDQFSLAVVAYRLLTGTLPYGGLGGKAGWPQFGPRMAGRFLAPSTASPFRAQLPSSLWEPIDRLLTRSLALSADARHPTPQAWLDDWDAIDLVLRQLDVACRRIHHPAPAACRDGFTQRLARLRAWLFGFPA